MNRAALYALVWEKPVTHVAIDFGVSDVAIRKICIKHGVPTPPLGYWAKLQHDKKVSRQPLPPLKKGQSDTIRLVIKPKEVLPADIALAFSIAEQEKVEPGAKIAVPTKRPLELHPIAIAREKKINRTKANGEGFLTIEGTEVFAVQIGPKSIERSILLIHAFCSAATDKGYILSTDGECRIVVDEQPLAVRIYEFKDKAAHVPSVDEMERKTKENEWRSRQKISESTRKIYRSWDYFPSGRLILEIFDPHQARWQADPVVGRWRDRSTKRLEDQLGDAIAALKVGAARARHQRAKETEGSRIRQEAEERRRNQERQRRLLDKVKAFLMEKADTYSQVAKLESLAVYLAGQGSNVMSDERNDLNRAIEFVLSSMRNGLTAEAITEEIAQKRLLEVESWW